MMAPAGSYPVRSARLVESIDQIWSRHMGRPQRDGGDDDGGPLRPLPDSWVPSRRAAVLARQFELELADEVRAFRAYHRQRRTRRVRWNRAFCWWLWGRARAAAVAETQVPLDLLAPATRTE